MSIKPRRSLNAFDLSHEYKGTCNMGWLIPVLCQDVIPGDTMDLTTDVLVRMEALIAPVMHRYHVSLHTFYLTERAMMPKEHENFITGGKNGDDDTVWPHITSPSGGYLRGSLGDYLGFPCNTLVNPSSPAEGEVNQITGTYDHSAYPMRMYAKIFNQYYINENIQTEVASSEDPGLDTTTNTDLLRCNWKKDYFTSALDDTQRGDPVYIPLGTSAPIISDNLKGVQTVTNAEFTMGITARANSNYGDLYGYQTDEQKAANALNSSHYIKIAPDSLRVDLTQASSAPYDEFRKAARVNYLLELNKRAGYRIVEWTLAHFGVKVPDDTIYEPVYLGGGVGNIMITPIEQTSETTQTSPQGNLAGRGTSGLRTRHIRKTFTQHGWVMTIMSIMPDAEYSQGLPKKFQRKTRWDYALPVLDGMGDDKILESEIYTTGTDDDNGEFGYKPRNEEYRTEFSTVHGEMRKGGTQTYWTGGRLFDSAPALNDSFIKADPSYRVFAGVDETMPHFTFECWHHLRMLRPLSVFGDPGLI